jgi:hypothetical protein
MLYTYYYRLLDIKICWQNKTNTHDWTWNSNTRERVPLLCINSWITTPFQVWDPLSGYVAKQIHLKLVPNSSSISPIFTRHSWVSLMRWYLANNVNEPNIWSFWKQNNYSLFCDFYMCFSRFWAWSPPYWKTPPLENWESQTFWLKAPIPAKHSDKLNCHYPWQQTDINVDSHGIHDFERGAHS